LLPINNYDVTFLNRITSLEVEGDSGTRGPLETIPPNICFLPNLQVCLCFLSFSFDFDFVLHSKVLNISFNRLVDVDSSFLGSNPSCLENLRILDISNNYLNEFPSSLLIKTTNLEQLLLENNQLTSLDLAVTVLVSTLVDLSNNQISKITNNANINISTYNSSLYTPIDLTNNNPIIDLTDAIYEMYGACYEIEQVFNRSLTPRSPLLTISLLNIDFDISKINCSCNQYYIQKLLMNTFNGTLNSSDALSNTMCTDGTLFYNNTNTLTCTNSSVNFTTILPRLCTLNVNDGNITFVNTTNNISGVS